jgi:Amt family ammonium transporter
MNSYVGISLLVAAFVYPTVAAWVWGGGWLLQKGFHDFAGSGVIHLLGGTCGFWGAYFLGPRIGRFRTPDQIDLK